MSVVTSGRCEVAAGVVDVVGSPLPPIVIVRTFSLSRAMMCDDSVMNDKRSKDT
jgi:hypothetical protein